MDMESEQGRVYLANPQRRLVEPLVFCLAAEKQEEKYLLKCCHQHVRRDYTQVGRMRLRLPAVWLQHSGNHD